MTSDVAIIGGGVMGCATAYFLALRGARVSVLEHDPTYAFASSALSASSIRQQFSSAVCMEMSKFGYEVLNSIDAYLGIDGDSIDVGLVKRGYLYLAHDAAHDQLAAAFTAQRSQGVDVERLDRGALEHRFPWLQTGDLTLGVYGRSGEGWFDGYSLLQAFRRKAKSLGVCFVAEKAAGLTLAAGRVELVVTQSGREMASVVINAAGFAAGDVARWAHWDLPIGPERRCIFAFECGDAPLDMPLIVDTSGIYVRPEGRHFIVGGPATPGPDLPCFDVDYQQFEDVVWPALAHRVPAFEELRLQRGWAGQYDMNFFDHNALIGRCPALDNFYVIGGFSGHGMQHAAAAGRGLSELIVDGRFTSLDLTPLDPNRVARGARFEELNII